MNLEDRTKAIERMVGNTPLFEIELKFRGKKRRVFAKAEYFNFTGSIKDRMALHIIKEGYRKGKLQDGFWIAEATSGNTGISFSAIGKACKHNVVIYMPNWMSKERIALIKSYGADVVLVSKDEGGFLGSIEMCDKLAEEKGNVFLPHQFSNDANCDAHFNGTGPEILAQLQAISLQPDGFIAGVGTGGTIMGTGRFLKEQIPEIQLFPLEPAESPTLKKGHKVGNHRIQGISDEFIPAIVHLEELDEVIDVSDGDAILMAQKLAAELGLAVGISSGANFIGALKVQERLGNDAVVATVFADSSKKYVSTDLFGDETVKENYYSPDVELLSYKTLGRLAETN